MHPMLKSEKQWTLNSPLGKLQPDKISTASIFNVGNEDLKFQGSENMSPFNFDSFTTYFTSKFEVDSCKIGVNIM